MTMYEKHIEALESIDFDDPVSPNDRKAIDAAIEIMRAAEPKDEAAEREHCTQQSYAAANNPQQGAIVDWLMRERAAARAEGYADGRAEFRATFKAELNDYAAKLAAAQAELQELNANWKRDVDALETRLEKLRAASEHVRDWGKLTAHLREQIDAAIEASKK
jgi:hypothetical protein